MADEGACGRLAARTADAMIRPRIIVTAPGAIVVERESATSIRVDLPFAVGMHYDLDTARQLRNALTAALEAISPADERVQEAITWGRATGLNWAAQERSLVTANTGRIHAIKRFREMTGCSLADAKNAIDRAWPPEVQP